jgi:hypothetical protein
MSFLGLLLIWVGGFAGGFTVCLVWNPQRGRQEYHEGREQ